jgi:endonuclease YncB( thermonuclease family)
VGWRGWLIVVAACCATALGLAITWPAPGPGSTWWSRPPDAQPMVVDDVLSGDTVILISTGSGPQVQANGQITARLLSINAPNFGITDECYAQEAQAKLASLLPEGSLAWVATDEVAKDEGGRYLMYVWSADDRFVNYELALGGFARAVDMPPNDERWSAISGAQETATNRLRGLWVNCLVGSQATVGG